MERARLEHRAARRFTEGHRRRFGGMHGSRLPKGLDERSEFEHSAGASHRRPRKNPVKLSDGRTFRVSKSQAREDQHRGPHAKHGRRPAVPARLRESEFSDLILATDCSSRDPEALARR